MFCEFYRQRPDIDTERYLRRTHRRDASSKSRKNASSVQDSQAGVTSSTAGKSSTQRERGGANRQAPLATDKVAETVCEEGSKESTCNEQRNDVLADKVSCGAGDVVESELVLERVESYRCSDKRAGVSDHARSTGRDDGEHIDAPVVNRRRRWPFFNNGEDAHSSDTKAEWNVKRRKMGDGREMGFSRMRREGKCEQVEAPVITKYFLSGGATP